MGIMFSPIFWFAEFDAANSPKRVSKPIVGFCVFASQLGARFLRAALTCVPVDGFFCKNIWFQENQDFGDVF